MTSSCLTGWPGWPSQYTDNLITSSIYHEIYDDVITRRGRGGHFSTDDVITSSISRYINDDVITCRGRDGHLSTDDVITSSI